MLAPLVQSEVLLVCVPPDDVADIWPRVEMFIRRALARGGLGTSLAKVQADVLTGRALLWLVVGDTVPFSPMAAVITQLTDEGAGKVCTIVAFGGDGGRSLHLLAQIEAYAQAEGCERMRIEGRLGWQRKLRWPRSYMVMEKPLRG